VNEVKVSVVTATYNHEKFLPHTLQSIVEQKVNFKYEVLVGEDCSTDNTAAVVREYAEKYPDIIVPYIREKNLGMTGNAMDLVARAKGEYVAFIEGDDYWIDEDKLQKQVDFLDTHPDYIAVFGKCIIVDEEERRHPEVEQYSGFVKTGGEYTIKEFKDYLLPGQTATAVYRKVAYGELMKKMQSIQIDASQMIDRMLVLCMLSLGKMHVMDEEVAAYRRMMNVESGSWSSKNDFYSVENLMQYLKGLQILEQVAQMLGLPLCFDKRRNYELKKLYDNRNHFSANEFVKLQRAIQADYKSKLAFFCTKIKLLLRRS
jgi:glycosyltransferase involved in cell wall biosynthesis